MAPYIRNYYQHILDILISDGATYDELERSYTCCYAKIQPHHYEKKIKITRDSIEAAHQKKDRGNLPRHLQPGVFYDQVIADFYDCEITKLRRFAKHLIHDLKKDNIFPIEWEDFSAAVNHPDIAQFDADDFRLFIYDLLKKDKNKELPNTVCRVVSYETLRSLGYTARKIAEKLVENDYLNFEGISSENEGTPQQWSEYLQNNTETFQYLINQQNEIIGNWSIVALNDECFEKAMNGELFEKDIDINKTELIYQPGTYKGYILNFVLLSEYRNNDNYSLVVNSFLDQLEKYAEKGIFFERWCANAFSSAFEALVKSIGLQYRIDHKIFGKIYHCDFIPLPDLPIYKQHKKLSDHYNNISN